MSVRLPRGAAMSAGASKGSYESPARDGSKLLQPDESPESHPALRSVLFRLAFRGATQRWLAPPCDHRSVDDDLSDVIALRKLVHDLEHQVLHDGAQRTRAGLEVDRASRNRLHGIRRELQAHTIHGEELRVLLHHRVLRPQQYF